MFNKKKREEINRLSREKIDKENKELFDIEESSEDEFGTYEDFKRELEEEMEESTDMDLEKGDIFPIILGGFIALSPVFLFLILILVIANIFL